MPTPPPQRISRSRVETGDPLQARELVEEAYGARLKIAADHAADLRLTLNRLRAGEVELADLEVPLDLTMTVSAQERYVFSTMLGGTAELQVGRETTALDRGDTHLGITPDGGVLAVTRRLRVRTVSLPASVLDDAAGALGHPAGAWRFTGRRPIPGGGRRWRQTTESVRRLLGDLEGEVAPLITGPAARLLAGAALTTFPNTAVAPPPGSDGRDARRDVLRRAVSFIDANPDLDITLADIARAAHVTPRAVQFSFRRHLDTTPLTYLREVRLHHAHVELSEADGDGDGVTVSRVATDWGFSDPGRFAAHYRAVYGRSPRDAARLRRRDRLPTRSPDSAMG